MNRMDQSSKCKMAELEYSELVDKVQYFLLRSLQIDP